MIAASDQNPGRKGRTPALRRELTGHGDRRRSEAGARRRSTPHSIALDDHAKSRDAGQVVAGARATTGADIRDIDTEPSTRGWYTGTHAFAPLAFSRDLESFSSSVSSVIASTPGSSGSSGFGGGGFSGGGGGGGGGGSW